ncbi:DUF6961 family protein [Sphingomonas sp.]|uniref:DUF6961 family protein n=1 Tax=Sphingomonas sp. TaxID=28214 RepID=UPI002E2F908E|nr:hypothetical protein [Sphingomonas sp.]HEX4693622.1 hypothetical protein [Sphingomonas sp.]
MALTDAEWRLAEALAMHKRYGDDAPIQVAERLGGLAISGDEAGVERWQQIAVALDGLMRSSRQ